MGYYMIKFFSEVYIFKNYTTCDRANELVVKAQYLIYMK